MTLCIICECDQNPAGEPVAYSVADTRLVVTRLANSGSHTEKAAIPRLLPENVVIAHQTEYGIKVYPILQTSTAGAIHSRALVFCIAGAVALGLHSLIHLEARLNGTPLTGSMDELLNFIVDTLQRFWGSAFDQDIEYLFTVVDSNQLHLYKIVGKNKSSFQLSKIERIHGFLFGVIGDGAKEITEEILQDTQSFCVSGVNVSEKAALFIASVRALKRSIRDQSIITIGGGIQACKLEGNKAENLLVCVEQGECYYRGAKIHGVSQQDVGGFGLGAIGSSVLILNRTRYDPNLSIEQIAKQFDK